MGSGGIFAGTIPPIAFQKAMVFVDGTNLFCRLRDEKLKVPRLLSVLEHYVKPRQLVRAYLYTVENHNIKARAIHGEEFLHGIRVVLGHGVENKVGALKEKGVDALLVADMIYHAASRNCEYALVVTTDQDFMYAIRRVENFGCRTALLSFCREAPSNLAEACDDYHHVTVEFLLNSKFAIREDTTVA